MSFDDFDPFDDDLGTGTTSRPRYPYLMLKEQGQQWVGMVVDYNDKAPKYVKGPQGRRRATSEYNGVVKEKTQDILTVLLMPGTNALMLVGEGDDAEVVPAQVGTVVNFFISGHNRFTAKDSPRPQGVGLAWRNAIDAKGNFRRGNVVKATFDLKTDVGAGGVRLTIPKHILSFQIRDAKPEEAALTARCREEFAKANGQARETVPAYVHTGAPVPESDAF